MKLLELATGSKTSEFTVVLVIITIIGCQAIGIDSAIILPLILDGSDVIKYEMLIKTLGQAKAPSSNATWALAAIGVIYPIVRAYIKKLKAGLPAE